MSNFSGVVAWLDEHLVGYDIDDQSGVPTLTIYDLGEATSNQVNQVVGRLDPIILVSMEY